MSVSKTLGNLAGVNNYDIVIDELYSEEPNTMVIHDNLRKGVKKTFAYAIISGALIGAGVALFATGVVLAVKDLK